MDYSTKTLSDACEIFADGLKDLLASEGYFGNVSEIDDIGLEIECFLDTRCVSHGTESDTINFLKDMIEEEIDRRVKRFECHCEDDEGFLRACIKEHVCRENTMYVPGSLYSSFADVFEYVLFECNGTYFVMDFTEVGYDWEFFFDKFQAEPDELMDKAYNK